MLSFVFAACLALSARAATEVVNGITWNYSVSNGKATVIQHASYLESMSGNVVIPSTLGGYPVTSIGHRAFTACSSLTSVVIPEGVTSIGNDAFSGCSGLTSVVIPEGVTSISDRTFSGCSGLSSVVIPEGVTSIGNDAFSGCSGLTSVVIPEGVISIGGCAFLNCSKLVHVTLPDGLRTIAANSRDAFGVCSSLKSIEIPDTVTEIGGGSFYDCTNLEYIKLPPKLKILRDRLFLRCADLKTIDISDDNEIEKIEYGVFNGCKSLSAFTLPDGIMSIESETFRDCSSLTSMTIPDSVTSIGNSAFSGCSCLTSLEIPEGVISIGNSAFYNVPVVVVHCDAFSGVGGNLVVFDKKYAANWQKVLVANQHGISNQHGNYEEIINYAAVDVTAEMITPKTMTVKYKVRDAKGDKVKIRAVAFKDGARSFANVVPVKTGENVPNGSEVAVGVEHSFVWNVPEDWDEDLAKVKVEILVQEGQLLPQDLITIPADSEHKEMTITRNSITYEVAFNALLWCYAEEDEALTLSSGALKVNGTTICDGNSFSTGNYYRPLLNYLYGKMGYKVLMGDDLIYAEQMTRLDFADSSDAEWNMYTFRYNEGKPTAAFERQLSQVAIKIEE